MLNKLYSDFPAVAKYHVFESMDIEEVSMQIGRDHEKEWTNLMFPKRECEFERVERLETSFPTQLVPPGVKEIKQVELYTKFRPLMKPINMDTTCPYPGIDVMERIKKQRTEKRVSKKRKVVAPGAARTQNDETAVAQDL